MRFVSALCMLAAGCDAAFGLIRVPPTDALSDAVLADVAHPGDDGAGLCFGTGTGLVTSLCVPAGTTIPSSLDRSVASLDTNTGCSFEVLQMDGPSLCVMIAQTITVEVGTTLAAHGTHPLVLLGVDGITIDGTVDVASRSATGAPGPGAGIGCITTGIDGPPSQTGGAGGAGGSFGGPGGAGGAGSAVAGGQPAAKVNPLTIVRGGCPGGAGGSSNTPGTSESNGGGAIYLVSGQQIMVSGTIDASGAGGAAGLNSSGGSGGGSGGLIGFDAPALTVASSATLFANGGGGGQGGVALAAAGMDPVSPLVVAKGGNNGIGTAAGGSGAAGPKLPTAGTASGGGGGGGAGRVLIFAPPASTMLGSTAISPTPG